VVPRIGRRAARVGFCERVSVVVVSVGCTGGGGELVGAVHRVAGAEVRRRAVADIVVGVVLGGVAALDDLGELVDRVPSTALGTGSGEAVGGVGGQGGAAAAVADVVYAVAHAINGIASHLMQRNEKLVAVESYGPLPTHLHG
jgi:hypothetical protein